MGIVLNLEEDNVGGVVLLGDSDDINEGDTVKRTGRIASLKVGEGMLGRVINTLGELSMAKVTYKAKLLRCHSKEKHQELFIVSR